MPLQIQPQQNEGDRDQKDEEYPNVCLFLFLEGRLGSNVALFLIIQVSPLAPAGAFGEWAAP